MGREWYWGRSLGRGEKESSTVGCMSGVLHYFDFHHLLFSGSGSRASPEPSQQSVRTGSSTTGDQRSYIVLCRNAGVEAPRHSPELDARKATSTTGDEFFEIPIGRRLPPTLPKGKMKKKTESLEEERPSMQVETPRTPGVIARLMGLDGLPEPLVSSPAAPDANKPGLVPVKREKPKAMSKKKAVPDSERGRLAQRQPLGSLSCNAPLARLDTGTRSLPDTPRPSSSRSWDVDPRLSLQIHRESGNKNNNRAMHEPPSCLCKVAGDDLSLPASPPHRAVKPRKSDLRRWQDENQSPKTSEYAREYAQEIVKQVKEGVSKRKGSGEFDGDHHNIKSRRTRRPLEKIAVYDTNESWNQTKLAIAEPPPPACSSLPPPRLRANLLDRPRSKLEEQIPNLKSITKPPHPESKTELGQCKKNVYERFTARIKKPVPPPAAVSVRPLSSDKKLVSPSQAPASWHRARVATRTGEPNTSSELRWPAEDPEYRYVRCMLQRGGFMAAPALSPRWYSSSLPVDPIIFNRLELELPVEEWQYRKGERQLGPLRHRWNRKLLFHLVEEILGDFLFAGRWAEPTTQVTLQDRRCPTGRVGGESLLRLLWARIRSLPSADCQVLGDVDALVAADLAEGSSMRRLLLHPLVAEAAADVVADVEEGIWDGLLEDAGAWSASRG